MKDLSNYIELLLDDVLSGEKNVQLTEDGVYIINITKSKTKSEALVMDILVMLDQSMTEDTIHKIMKDYFSDEVKYEIFITFV